MKCPENFSPGCTCSTNATEPSDSCYYHGCPNEMQCPYCGQFRKYHQACTRCGCSFGWLTFQPYMEIQFPDWKKPRKFSVKLKPNLGTVIMLEDKQKFIKKLKVNPKKLMIHYSKDMAVRYTKPTVADANFENDIVVYWGFREGQFINKV